MKIVVDYDRCESNGLCMGILPEVFEVRDDDFMYVLDEHPPEKYRAKVMQAVNACPTQAISVVEDEEPHARKEPAHGKGAVGQPMPDPVYASGTFTEEPVAPPAGEGKDEPGKA
jgi:ferredoxin